MFLTVLSVAVDTVLALGARDAVLVGREQLLWVSFKSTSRRVILRLL